MCTTSPSTAKLDEALAKAQGEFTNPEKNRTVRVRTKAKDGREAGEYSFEYATFDAVIEMARPVLARHGIAVSQFPSSAFDDKGNINVSVVTRVAHAGEWMQSTITGPVDGFDMQKIGSGLTYLERYSYCAILGIVSEYDDDGAAAGGHESEPVKRQVLPNCPKCGTNKSVIVGKPEFGGGFVCFAKKGGCGEKWQPAEQGSPSTPTDTRKQAREYEAAMSPEELEQFTTTRNAFVERISKADSLMTLDEIASDLKTSHERIKGVVRPLWAARKKVLQGEQLPPGAGEENP